MANKRVTRRKLLEERLDILKPNKSGLIKKADKKKILELEEEIKKSKKGSSSKIKGATYERKIADIFYKYTNIQFRRTPQSGGFAKDMGTLSNQFKGDIIVLDEKAFCNLHIECKNQKTWKLKDWLKQAISDCPEGLTPVVIFHQNRDCKDGKLVAEADDFITLRLQDFLKLVPKEAIIERKKAE